MLTPYVSKPQIDAYRRNLQRGYVELRASRMTGPKPATNDQRPMFRGELTAIDARAAAALARAADAETRLHLEDLRHEIAENLLPDQHTGNLNSSGVRP